MKHSNRQNSSLVTLMDLCHLKKTQIWKRSSKNTTDVVLRGEVVKDDSGSYAVFTDHGSSASHTTAAIVLDVTCRLPGCAGQTSDAVSAYTQVQMEDAPKLKGLRPPECPTWIRLPRSLRSKSWDEIQDPVVPLERNLHGHPSAGLQSPR